MLWIVAVPLYEPATTPIAIVSGDAPSTVTVCALLIVASPVTVVARMPRPWRDIAVAAIEPPLWTVTSPTSENAEMPVAYLPSAVIEPAEESTVTSP